MAATILVVDSDLIDRADWQALLQFHGYKVITAQNGRAALEKLSSKRPDLILIDLGLKDIPGHEVGRQIQKLPGYSRTPIVYVGPYFERFSQRMSSGIESGGFRYIGSREEAFDRVQSILGGSTGLLFENGTDSFPMSQD